jgi:hypothetical protein
VATISFQRNWTSNVPSKTATIQMNKAPEQLTFILLNPISLYYFYYSSIARLKIEPLISEIKQIKATKNIGKLKLKPRSINVNHIASICNNQPLVVLFLIGKKIF